MTDHDARIIVIGAGHNGLVCAAYLARAGHEVTVLEAAAEPGGAAVTREFAPGFRVPACAHLLYLLDDGIRKELALDKHGLRMARSGLVSIGLDPDGGHVRIAGASVGGVADADQEAMQAHHRRMRRFAHIIGRLHNRQPPRLGTTDRRDLASLARLALDIRTLGRTDMREFLRIAGINIYDVLQEHFENPVLKGALSLDAVLGTFLGPRSNNSVFCALHRLSGGGDYALPAGGMGAVTAALASAAREAGAEIRTGSPVARILVDHDRVSGVELDDGEWLPAAKVVSSADPRATLHGLLGARHLEAGFAHRVGNIRMRGCAAKVHLALDGMPEFTGLDAAGAGERLLIAPSLEYVERAFNHAKYGEHSAAPVAEMTLPSLHDDSLAPAGQHVLSAVVQWAPRNLKQGWADARAAFLDTVIDTMARYAPGIREQILHAELLTPEDIERQFRITGGHWHHGELSLDQFLMMRPVPGAGQYATPVPGLWLCGAGSHPGGGVMGSAGRNAARAIVGSNRE